MAIALSLTLELEARLREKATQQGLDDFEVGRFRSFDDFAKEHKIRL